MVLIDKMKSITHVRYKNDLISCELTDKYIFIIILCKNLIGNSLWTLYLIGQSILCDKFHYRTIWNDHIKLKILKILPTYGTLFKRKANYVKDNLCPICRRYEEDWHHIWICKCNNKSLMKIVNQTLVAFEEELVKEMNQEKLCNFRKTNIEFAQILYEDSKILQGRFKVWELISGIYIII